MRIYTWKEVKDFLVKELKGTKHIMTFGTIGSCNIEHDIDLIITKKPKSKTSAFYKELHNLFDELNVYLHKNYGSNLSVFHFSSEEFLLKYILGKGNLFFHSMVYLSYPQILMDWHHAVKNDKEVKNILLKDYDAVYGDVRDIFSQEFQTKSSLDNLYIYLYLYDRINSNYPESLLLEEMNNHFNYIFKKRLGLKSPVAKNSKGVREIFYKLCDILDKEKEKKKKLKR